jgi:hypothetical protein
MMDFSVHHHTMRSIKNQSCFQLQMQPIFSNKRKSWLWLAMEAGCGIMRLSNVYGGIATQNKDGET